LEDCWILAKSIAKQLGISHDQDESIIHEDLNMRKLSVKWVPKCLNADQKHQRRQLSEQLVEFFQCDPKFMSRLVTMDETWLYHYDPETKQQSEWQHSGSTHPKKFQVQKSAGKVLPSIFWDQNGIHIIDYLPKGQTQHGVLLISAGAIEGHFEGKTPREVDQVGLVLA
jgi:histone-lysine N-methyltransferase SETMAR